MVRLADYRRQFEKTTRTTGEDPSIFAIALETLAVKAFGDMGQTARLRLSRDSHPRCGGPMSGVGESCGPRDP